VGKAAKGNRGCEERSNVEVNIQLSCLSERGKACEFFQKKKNQKIVCGIKKTGTVKEEISGNHHKPRDACGAKHCPQGPEKDSRKSGAK